MREKLPDRRKCITQRLKINGQTVHFTVGLYPDGRPGELFIDMHKTGTSVRAWCESTAKLVSLMLQYGVPLSELVGALVGQCTEPFGRVPVSGHEVIMDAAGVLDAVVRSMALDFLAIEGQHSPDKTNCAAEFFNLTEDMGATEIHETVEVLGESEALERFIAKFV